MSGAFQPGSIPPLPGVYFDYEVAQSSPPTVNTLGIVAVPFVHSWGPENSPQPLGSFGDFLSLYGAGNAPTSYTQGFQAVYEAFLGEGLPGRGGAGQVIGYRLVGSGGAYATLAIQNATPALAITLNGKYKGTYGNKLAYTKGPNAGGDAAKRDFSVWLNGNIVETYTYTSGDMNDLAGQINAKSHWVTVTVAIASTSLPDQLTPVSLAGGNDGATVTNSDWTTMMTALSTQRFSVFAAYDLSADAQSSITSLLASLVTWGQGLNAAGKRAFFVTGGPLTDSASTAAARALTMNDPNFITIGVGTYSDPLFGTLSSSELAPRLAGIIANRGDAAGLSFARMAGLSILTGATDSDILASITNGWMSIGRDSNQLAPVRFEKGITTYTTTNNAARPFAVYSNPKFVRTMQQIELDLTEWAEANVIGQLPVDDTTIQYVLGHASAEFKALEADRVIQPGWTVVRNPTPTPTPSDDFIAVQYGVAFKRDTEKILNTVTMQ